MLRFLPEKVRVRIRKSENAVIQMNGSEFSARVPRQPRMTYGIDVARPHLLAHFEARRHRYVALRVNAIGDQGRYLFWSQRRGRWGGARRGHTTFNLSGCHQ